MNKIDKILGISDVAVLKWVQKRSSTDKESITLSGQWRCDD